MSILIKGMEMPKRCIDCTFMISRDNDDCILQSDEANATFETWDDMKANCPLVEIPPHGELIDKVELKKSVLKWLPHDPCGIQEKERPFETDICVSLMIEIEEQPVIIPEEGSET